MDCATVPRECEKNEWATQVTCPLKTNRGGGGRLKGDLGGKGGEK